MLCFQVALPADGTAVTLEAENAEAPVEGTDTSSEYGGQTYVKNTGTQDALLGGNDQACHLPFNPADPTAVFDMGPNDTLTAKVATAGTAGQITVMKVVK